VWCAVVRGPRQVSGQAASADLDAPVDMGPVAGSMSKRAVADQLVFSYYSLLVEIAKRLLHEVWGRARDVPLS
jgi:hypothetical protein